MVYTPAQPGLHWLNSSAWLIFALCDGVKTAADIAEEYSAAVGGAAESTDTQECLSLLYSKGLLIALSI